MKTWLMAAAAIVAFNGPAVAAERAAKSAGTATTAPKQIVQRRSTPDTSTPGSTAPGGPINTRPAYVSREAQYFAAEIRQCEIIGESAARLACKESVRDKYGEM